MKYSPIDYSKWDFSGQGKNILPLLNETERKIWEITLPSLDKRDDVGHAEIVTYFGIKLLENVIGANRDVVVPADILHDSGWGKVTPTEIKLFYEMEMDHFTKKPIWQRYEPILRTRHQEQGKKFAEELLANNNFYNEEIIKEISDIIYEHDTRKGFLNVNDGVVRDADKLYRYHSDCLELAARKGRTFESGRNHIDESKAWIDQSGFFYSDVSKEMAKIELENALGYLKTKGV